MEDINLSITNIVYLLGFTQGIILGLILIFENRQIRPSLFLGLFLITYSTEALNIIIYEELLFNTYPSLIFLPIDFYFLSPVLLFLYAKSLIGNITQKDYWLLLPGIIEFVVVSICFCFPVTAKSKMLLAWEASIGFIIYSLLFFIFVVYFIITIIRIIQKHQIRAKNYFSNLQNRQLKWVKLLAWYQLMSIFMILSSFPLKNIIPYEYQQILFSITNSVFIYWVGLHGLRQSKIEIPAYLVEDRNDKAEKSSVNNLPQKVSEDHLEKDFQYLLEIMNNEKPYINPELTLSDLGKLIQMPDKKLSHLINQKAAVNFSNFINQYRIDAAKEMLTNPQFNHLNMLGIGFEVGFNSKANFYTVFKKVTNTTPAKFKKRQKDSF